MLTLPVDQWIGNAAAVLSGVWGAVTQRSQQSGYSRTAIYQHAERVVQAQIEKSLPDDAHADWLTLAYEPRWARHHPDWEHRLWRDDDLPKLGVPAEWFKRTDKRKVPKTKSIEGDTVNIDMADEVLRGTTVINQGELTWPPPAPRSARPATGSSACATGASSRTSG